MLSPWPVHLTADVTDGNNDALEYEWSASGGSIAGDGSNVTWYAPGNEGIYLIQLKVSDGRGGEATASINILVTDLSTHVAGDLIAWYPFTGNAQDHSGNNLHGNVSGAKLTPDSTGTPNTAYFFDGNNDHIRVINQPILNFGQGITRICSK